MRSVNEPKNEASKLKLAEIRQRYNIPLGRQEAAHAGRVPQASVAPSRLDSVEALKPQLLPHLADEIATLLPTTSLLPSPDQDVLLFCFVIRIAECSVDLLCEVAAENSNSARELVEQLPNLLHAREISQRPLRRDMVGPTPPAR